MLDLKILFLMCILWNIKYSNSTTDEDDTSDGELQIPMTSQEASTTENTSETLNLDNRIMGGKVAEWEEYSYMAFIYYNERSAKRKRVSMCGGTLLSDRWALTAAHCLPKKEGPRMNVIVGYQKIGSKYIEYRWKAAASDLYIMHPEYTPKMHDIALVRIKNRLPPSNKYSFVKLSQSSRTDNCKTVGYGVINVTTQATNVSDTFKIIQQIRDPERTLRVADVNVTSYEECEKSYQWIFPDKMNLFIWVRKWNAELPFYGVVYGDSGGPLMCDGTQAGVSSGFLRTNIKKPCDRFTKVQPHMKWIEQTMEKFDTVLGPRIGTKSVGGASTNIASRPSFCFIILFSIVHCS